MIFNNNTTSLGSTNIPMAEGYDCSYGCALALVESARNDYAMFRAMLDADARELAIKNESTGYVAESQISALHEAAASGILNKIKELLKKLVAKIKAIIHSFVAKINTLFMKDKDLIKKYQNEVLRKSNIGKLEVKWRKLKSNADSFSESSINELLAYMGSADGVLDKWSSETSERWSNLIGHGVENSTDYKEYLEDSMWEDDSPSNYEIDEIGGIRHIISELSGYKKEIDDYEKYVKKMNNMADKTVRDIDKMANDIAKGSVDKGDKMAEHTQDEVTAANHMHDMYIVIQDAITTNFSTMLAIAKIDYAQYRAAFNKAVTANDKKLKEQSIYLDAVAEAAEQEVEDVISGALKSDGDYLSSTSIAPTNVMDDDVSNDANKLVYDKVQNYSTNVVEVDKAGTIDTNINSKEESAFFGALLY